MRPGSSLVTALLLASALAACAGTGAGNLDDDDDLVGTDARGPGDGDGGTGTGDGGSPDGRPIFRRCVGRGFTPPPAAGFATALGPLTAASGAPVHAAEDTVAVPASSPHLVARFAYGPLTSTLGGEPVAVELDDCTGWRSLGTHTTDLGGRIELTADLALGPGVYEVRYVVVGDASLTTGYLWLAPAGTHLAVTDIDGTLTTSDGELFQQILDGTHVPVAYPSAAELTTTHADKGHIVVYMTGRPSSLTQRTRDWLAGLGFAPGPVRLAPGPLEALPTDTGVGTYKRDYLTSLTASGFTLDLAYGNATTDIFAYTGAGIAATQQWIIGTNAGASGTNAVMDTWAARVAEVAQGPAVTQPFRF